MRTSLAVPLPRSLSARAVRRVGVACAALLSAFSLIAPATVSAAGHGPRYSLKVVEGETTLPEYDQVASTSGSVSPSAQVAVSIIRGGTTVYRDVQGGGSAWLSQVPQVGDVVTLESPVGVTIGSVVYDGLPSIDASVCAGSTNFSGQNSSGYTVEGFYLTDTLTLNPYGQVTGVHHANFSEAQVKSLSGTAFGGSFLTPLSSGETVGAVESLKTPLPGEATYTYTSEYMRPVGGCPTPPPVFVVPPVPALQGALLRLAHATIRSLLKSGWHDHVTINQPGTVTQDLYLKGGKLPAFAASTPSKHHPKVPPALLLARGVTTSKGAGTLAMHLKLTSKGRHKLKSANRVTVVLVTTLRTGAGVKLNLARRTVTLHH
jgi:hypothetical protein